MNLEYTIEIQEWSKKTGVLILSGQLDRAFQPAMDDEIQQQVDSGIRFWAVDLSGLEYLSSAGIAAMVNLKGKLDRVTGQMCFFAPTDRVNKVLEVMGLKRAYPFYDDENSAREAFPGA